MNDSLLWWRDIVGAAGRLALDVDDDLRSDVVDVQRPNLLTDGDQVRVCHFSWNIKMEIFDQNSYLWSLRSDLIYKKAMTWVHIITSCDHNFSKIIMADFCFIFKTDHIIQLL